MAQRKARPRFRRILLKLSGEVFLNRRNGESLDHSLLAATAEQLRHVQASGVEIGIVIGGGNIFRGLPGTGSGIDRTVGDNMGMLATLINSLALQSYLQSAGLKARVLTALSIPKVAELFRADLARRYLADGEILIFGGGTGNPFFTTDSAAALRAGEIQADVLMKATKVDGIFTADPVKHPEATRFEKLTYREALQRQLQIMDAAAFALCMENKIPIMVFNFFKPDEILRAARGEKVGTLVCGEE